MLKVLGIDRYTQRFKQWVVSKIEAASLYTQYVEYCEKKGDMPLFTTSNQYNNFLAAKLNMREVREWPGFYYSEEDAPISWDEYGLEWEHIAALLNGDYKDHIVIQEAGDGFLYLLVGPVDACGYVEIDLEAEIVMEYDLP